MFIPFDLVISRLRIIKEMIIDVERDVQRCLSQHYL